MPDNSALIRKARKLLTAGRFEDAYSIYESLLLSQLEDVKDLVNFAHLCADLGEGAQAIEYYSRALLLKPDNPEYMTNLGKIYLYEQRHTEAEFMLRKAVELNPNLSEALLYLGVLQSAFGNINEAIQTLGKALEINPNTAFANSELALVYAKVDRYKDALKYADKATRLDPDNAYLHDTKGRILSELGRAEQAEASFKKAIKLDRTMGTAYRNLAVMRKYGSKDKPFIDKLESILKESMPASRRMLMHSSLGKIYDDCHEWDKAFEHFRMANILEKTPEKFTPPYKLFKKIAAYFTSDTFARADIYRNQSAKPVFIVGMPRSGTTLIETIIGSHPEAAAGGELHAMDNIARKMCSTDDMEHVVSRCNEMLSDDSMKVACEEYLAVLDTISESAGRVVDKMPDNFFHLGLINLLFPNATIIHSNRNPLDTCLSCYFQPFVEFKWALDLDWIAERYIFYRHVMEYWKKVLPEGKIIDVHYENVIEHPEEESRRLIEACGLEWDPVCLEFNKSDRAVNTASLWQVRQPIYRTSKMRARHYAKHLTGLANKLQKYLPDDPEFRETFGIKRKFMGIF